MPGGTCLWFHEASEKPDGSELFRVRIHRTLNKVFTIRGYFTFPLAANVRRTLQLTRAFLNNFSKTMIFLI
jgi:hypothetical protein